ncbi:MAG: J domain-containing protein [Cyanobacteria bacterium]|nr:J domain-containing protein [Cyanobacteriota bacterium]MDW8202829.1 J domain-containing protein [Cyanobacteriota bacterium SKYGB_h_bin112]
MGEQPGSSQQGTSLTDNRLQAENYYAVLQLPITASIEDIRRVYRELSKLYHPDTTNLPTAYATAKFRQLNEAYNVLNDPDSRRAYDRQLSQILLRTMATSSLTTKPTPPRKSSAYLDPNDRPLSSGEVFALFIMAVSLVACLLLAIAIGILRGNTPAYSSVHPLSFASVSITVQLTANYKAYDNTNC